MVRNPLKEIEGKMSEFANSSGDFSAMAPEKLIDIADKDKDALGPGRDDFDAIMEPAVENKDSFPESKKKVKEAGLSVVRVPNPGTSSGSTVHLSHTFQGKPLKKEIVDINGRWDTFSNPRIYVDLPTGALVTSREGGAVITDPKGAGKYFIVQSTESNLSKIVDALK